MSASSIALGFFDGVHIAHQNIISKAVEKAKQNNLHPIALSFDASPLEVLMMKKVKYLTSIKEKESLISSLGAELKTLHTDMKLLKLSPEAFVKNFLVEKYNAKYVVCGYNYTFGKNAAGDSNLLKSLGERYGFEVEIAEQINIGGEAVSSSRIRSLLENGEIKEANLLLGRNFSVCGEVVHGKSLGSKIGFPTANVNMPCGIIIPKKGVYKSTVQLRGERFAAISNVGKNPTVGGEALRVETYIPKINSSLYGETLKIGLEEFIRPEMGFESVEKLREQIKKDVSLL